MPARVRPVRIAAAETIVERREDGVIYVRHPKQLGPWPPKITERLEYWAEHAGDRTFLAQRAPDGEWEHLTYRDALLRVRSVAQALLNRNLSIDRPVAILSGNSIEHALLALGAMYAGILYAPIAPAYSLVAKDHATLRSLWEQFEPGLVFASEGTAYERALDALPSGGAEIVVVSSPLAGRPSTSFAELLATPVTRAVDEAHAQVGPDTIAKILFTSGSTGRPKGVITTQRMLCSNQEMLRAMLQFLADEPPVLCDWLPWNHTFGGNHNFGIVLYNGGTLYIDEGKPTEKAFGATLRNLRDVAATACFNVPKGFEMLVPHLREDPAFRDRFFSRMKILFYAAAGMNQKVWDDLKQLAVESCGEEILMVTGLGATESAPFALSTGLEGAASGRVGLPAPGVELKLVPAQEKMEARLRGPNITPGFWRNDQLTRASFDDEGFYKLGDAMLFVDPADPLKGFLFDGRIADDFKLSTGTWVSVGPLRSKFLTHFGSIAQDVVIAGQDRGFVTALVFPNLPTCRAMCPGIADDMLPAHPKLRERFRTLLAEFAAASTGTSTCISRIILLDRPPSLDGMEITDKGSINREAVLKNRAELVEELYRPSPRVIEISEGS